MQALAQRDEELQFQRERNIEVEQKLQKSGQLLRDGKRVRKELRDRNKELTKLKQDLLVVRTKTVGEARDRVDAMLRSQNTNKSREANSSAVHEEEDRSQREACFQMC